MKIALISPASEIQNLYPPLGLGYIAAMCHKEGHECKIFDFSLKSNGAKRDAFEIVEFSPDLLGLSVMSNNYLSALTLARAVKSLTSAPIIMGGAHPSIFPEDVLKEECVDFVIRGEGEITFMDFLKHYQGTKVYENIQGLSYKMNNQIIHNTARPFVKNIDDLPFPERKLFGRYLLRSIRNKPMATLVTSRGCPFSCTFCYKDLFGRQYRYRSPENILEELELLIRDHSTHSIYFVDDLFNLRRERTKKLCHLILQKQLHIEWQCLSRVDTIDADLLQLMKKAGCEKIHYGVETGDSLILKKIKKSITLNDVKKAVSFTKEAGIAVKGYFMIGLPGDDEETIRKTLDLARELDFDELMFSLCTPFPGTEIWHGLENKPQLKDFHSMIYYKFHENIKPICNLSGINNERLSYFLRKGSEISLKKKYGKFLGSLISVFTRWTIGNIVIKRLYSLYQFFSLKK
jgi:anaerobic magnesium-protoporphyrin IX monomethyl ester cyclase